MRESRLRFLCAVGYLLLCASASGVIAADTNKVSLAQKNSFFQGGAGFAQGVLKAYANVPANEDALPSESYPQIVRQFNWWLNKVLKPEHVPAKGFVEENIKLAPANGIEQEEDLAFLSYEIGGITYMIVQTGGLGARMRVFVDDPGKGKLGDVEEARARARAFLDDYINETIRVRIPPFAVKEAQRGYVAEVEPAKSQEKFNHARCFMSGSEVCISIQKVSFEDSVPAREPMPNRWFSWWKEN